MKPKIVTKIKNSVQKYYIVFISPPLPWTDHHFLGFKIEKDRDMTCNVNVFNAGWYASKTECYASRITIKMLYCFLVIPRYNIKITIPFIPFCCKIQKCSVCITQHSKTEKTSNINT